jgi:predicted HTH domain antitoxin
MAITIDLPLDVQQELEHAWHGDLPRKIVEAIALEGYRQGALSAGQVSDLLGLHFHEAEAFLRQHGAWLTDAAEDIEQDTGRLDGLFPK